MSFNWFSLLDVAAEMIKRGGEEFHRTVINRSYYAVFGETRKLVEKRARRSRSSHGIHRDVIDFLKASADDSEQRVGHDLNRLRLERIKADYDASISIPKDTAVKVHIWALDLKTKLLALRAC
jgi:uncharacterized protein (UPF0332 family)